MPNSTAKGQLQAKFKVKRGSRSTAIAASPAAESTNSRDAILKSAATLFGPQGYSATTSARGPIRGEWGY
jgi:hypothetical protein